MVQKKIIKTEIIMHARNFGAEFVGFVPVEKWERSKDIPVEFYPLSIWPQTKTVIVLGISYLPVAPLHKALGLGDWNAANELLDTAAYRLAVFLNRKGYPSVNIPMDSSGRMIPEHKAVPVFSHAWAGYYAGICQANPKDHWGELPGLNLTSVLTVFE